MQRLSFSQAEIGRRACAGGLFAGQFFHFGQIFAADAHSLPVFQNSMPHAAAFMAQSGDQIVPDDMAAMDALETGRIQPLFKRRDRLME
jgi:hypothetical protein